MTPKTDHFFRQRRPETPVLVVDLDIVADSYRTLRRVLPQIEVFYAVKANPAPAILRVLADLGSSFDAASVGEIDACLTAGAGPERISYGICSKKQRDIAYAYGKGVRLFAFDSEAELDKLAEAAPGANVYCRILTPNGGADWPLSRKFGCELDMAADLMIRARELGLVPYGISFHVGSQQTRATQWAVAIDRVGEVFVRLAKAGITPQMVNIGGGFPITYREPVPGIEVFAEQIEGAVARNFGRKRPRMLMEPGRYMVGAAGTLYSEVVLVSRKSYAEELRWVYLDIGKFGGLAETMDECIKYAIRTPHDGGETGPVTIAGPTCDGADILYEKCAYQLPKGLRSGDIVMLDATGAYTTTYSAVNFNGFLPLRDVYI